MRLNSNTAPIGLFDSGVGGTSIWKEIHQLLPNENTLFLADSNHAPYGNRTRDEIVELSIKNTEFLLEQGCKIIVVACNTATTNAIKILRESYDVPFIGIEPAIKPAALQTHSKSIGILATKGTLSSALFHKTSEAISEDITIIEVIGEGLVPLIEEGRLESAEMDRLLEKYTRPMIDAQVDHIVLGCSHYPYIIPQLRKWVPNSIKIIDSGEAVAIQTKAVLKRLGLLSSEISQPTLQFFSNKDIATLKYLLQEVPKLIIEKREF